MARSLKGNTGRPKAKGECPNTKTAVLIDGKGAGGIFYLCQTEKCDVHNRVTRYQPTPQEQPQRKRVSGFVLANPDKSRKRLPSASRSSRGFASSKPSARSYPILSPGQTWRWSHSITSGAWATTIIAVSPSSTHGRRKRARPHGALSSRFTSRCCSPEGQGQRGLSVLTSGPTGRRHRRHT